MPNNHSATVINFCSSTLGQDKPQRGMVHKRRTHIFDPRYLNTRRNFKFQHFHQNTMQLTSIVGVVHKPCGHGRGEGFFQLSILQHSPQEGVKNIQKPVHMIY